MNEAALQLIEDRKTAYCVTFGGDTPNVAAVLNDLRLFCRADTSEFHPDERMHALLSGRREVWLRIEQHLKMDPETLLRIFGGSQ